MAKNVMCKQGPEEHNTDGHGPYDHYTFCKPIGFQFKPGVANTFCKKWTEI